MTFVVCSTPKGWEFKQHTWVISHSSHKMCFVTSVLRIRKWGLFCGYSLTFIIVMKLVSGLSDLRCSISASLICVVFLGRLIWACSVAVWPPDRDWSLWNRSFHFLSPFSPFFSFFFFSFFFGAWAFLEAKTGISVTPTIKNSRLYKMDKDHFVPWSSSIRKKGARISLGKRILKIFRYKSVRKKIQPKTLWTQESKTLLVERFIQVQECAQKCVTATMQSLNKGLAAVVCRI